MDTENRTPYVEQPAHSFKPDAIVDLSDPDEFEQIFVLAMGKNLDVRDQDDMVAALTGFVVKEDNKETWYRMPLAKFMAHLGREFSSNPLVE